MRTGPGSDRPVLLPVASVSQIRFNGSARNPGADSRDARLSDFEFEIRSAFFLNCVLHRRNLLTKSLHPFRYHCPNEFEIDKEVAMRDAVAHGVDVEPGKLGISGLQIRQTFHEISGCFAKDFNIPQHCILNQRIPDEAFSRHLRVYGGIRSHAWSRCSM